MKRFPDRAQGFVNFVQASTGARLLLHGDEHACEVSYGLNQDSFPGYWKLMRTCTTIPTSLVSIVPMHERWEHTSQIFDSHKESLDDGVVLFPRSGKVSESYSIYLQRYRTIAVDCFSSRCDTLFRAWEMMSNGLEWNPTAHVRIK